MQKIIHTLTPGDLKSLVEKFAFKTVQEKFTELSLLIKCKGYLGNIEPTIFMRDIDMPNGYHNLVLVDE